MKAFLEVFKITIQQTLIYRANFLLWRLRVLMSFLFIYFFWFAIFSSRKEVLGYERTEIFTYLMLGLILRSVVMASRSHDVAGEILQGDLSNFLLKPYSYFSYWWSKDLADKFLNLLLTFVELGLLYFLLKPPLFLQTDLVNLGFFILAAFIAMVSYFYFSFLVSLLAFWMRDVWSIRFLVIVAIEFLSGAAFPLDIFPAGVYKILSNLPFSYFMYFPLKVYLGDMSLNQIMIGVLTSFCWLVVFWVSTKFVWNKGLRIYGAEGR